MDCCHVCRVFHEVAHLSLCNNFSRVRKEKSNQIIREGERFFKVASQNGHGMYDVTKKENGSYLCTCPDLTYRSVVSLNGAVNGFATKCQLVILLSSKRNFL